MAKQVKPQNTTGVGTQAFNKDLVEDSQRLYLPPNSWTQARNAIPHTSIGDLGDLGNEPANKHCASATYNIIGAIHLEKDEWIIFSTDNTNSEIGRFKEDSCTYETVVNAECLNFSTYHLISGEAKENFDCTWQVYWDDGNNPTRTINVDNVPWIQNCEIVDECQICTDTDELDCEAIRLAPLVTNPCFTVSQGASGGELVNGSYYVTAAYTINQQKVTDYAIPSNVQGLFNHSGIAGSLDIRVDQMDDNFEEFELVLVIIRNQQTVARRVGIYSTRQTSISIDSVDDRWPSVGLDLLPLRNPVVEKSDAIYRNADYLLRVGPTDRFDFNYQPLANQITTKWQTIQYPADYYRKGGNNTGYMRDEVYAFFIRWVYNTGDKSASYHIPGRVGTPLDFSSVAGADAQVDIDDGLTPFRWRVLNTASVDLGFVPFTLPDGGTVISEGDMAYWESTERYDDDRPDVWNASSNPIWGSTSPAHDLCGKPIRHHRFPDNSTDTSGNLFTNHYSAGGDSIRIMGVRFDNIQPPLDNQGNPIQGVVGYEILRGTREGNKSIFAKGIINNMREYDISGGITPRTGLYPNYPYNDLGADPFMSEVATEGGFGTDINPDPVPLQTRYSQQHFTFHSPDTSFKDPFLSAKELRIYGEVNGTTEGQFVVPDDHPKHKLVTNLAFFVSCVAGLGLAAIALNGERRTTYQGPRTFNLGQFPTGLSNTFVFAPSGGGTLQIPADIPPGALGTASTSGIYTGQQAIETAQIDTGVALLLSPTSTYITGADYQQFYNNLFSAGVGAGTAPGTIGGVYTWEQSVGQNASSPLRFLNAIPTFTYYFSQGVDETLRLLQAFTPFQQYALQYQSHCLYDDFRLNQVNNTRRAIDGSIYLDPAIQDFGTSYRINNVYRSRTVALEIEDIVNNPLTVDNSRTNISGAGLSYDDPTTPFNRIASSHYVGLKQRFRNQYGQIESIMQVPVSTCATDINQTRSDVMFGGDIYIGRHTEKNTFFYFYNWLLNQPDGAEFNYELNKMLPHPTYWMDTEQFDIGEFVNSIITPITNIFTPWTWQFPSDKRALDRDSLSGLFVIKKAYMYLFNSGVRDFFVESEVNVEYRDWGDNDSERHYDYERYTDLEQIFNSSIIKAGNFWKYDYSLSISRLFNNFISWGNTQARNYNPNIAETCFTYRPERVLYSLQQQFENLKDYWRVFLPNNYKDFQSRVTAVKPVNKNGAIFLFETESPAQFLGVDQLQTDAGTKITIGDGGLFSQPVQNVLNTDDPYEYGSCQNRLSVINTASGLFWMSQNQGKVFQLAQGVKELSAFDLKWWFSKYLPYRLTEDFPDFELLDNPVAGIGCQSIYDNESQLVYFCKRDFELRKDILDTVTYTGSNDDFLVNGRLPIKLGDPRYFNDASWTISYDPKTESWIGWHDWHPNLLLPSKTSFLSIKNEGIWKHNDRCDLYCNFYGIDYPFEVEYATVTPQQVNTLRSVEYYMEVYKYADNCYDRFHVLDFNFDEATIYNSEQCSGLLRLNLSPKNNAPEIITYPQVNPANIQILFSKEEQKYRFNQFWDITADRGEFNPSAERVIWNTQPNGYIRDLNPNNLNYNKFELERKKFRHYKNIVLLRRRVCGNRNMVVSLSNNKNLNSPR